MQDVQKNTIWANYLSGICTLNTAQCEALVTKAVTVAQNHAGDAAEYRQAQYDAVAFGVDPNDTPALLELCSHSGNGSFRARVHGACAVICAYQVELTPKQTPRNESQATPLYAIHIIGPDDMIPAPSKEEADAACVLLNAVFMRHADPSAPPVKAEACEWPYPAEMWQQNLHQFRDAFTAQL